MRKWTGASFSNQSGNGAKPKQRRITFDTQVKMALITHNAPMLMFLGLDCNPDCSGTWHSQEWLSWDGLP